MHQIQVQTGGVCLVRLPCVIPLGKSQPMICTEPNKDKSETYRDTTFPGSIRLSSHRPDFLAVSNNKFSLYFILRAAADQIADSKSA